MRRTESGCRGWWSAHEHVSLCLWPPTTERPTAPARPPAMLCKYSHKHPSASPWQPLIHHTSSFTACGMPAPVSLASSQITESTAALSSLHQVPAMQLPTVLAREKDGMSLFGVGWPRARSTKDPETVPIPHGAFTCDSITEWDRNKT